MSIEFEITGLGIDTRTDQPLVILHNKGANDLILPIWIGQSEAQSIAITMQQLQFSRPTTHDLLLNTFSQLSANVNRIEIHTVRENTFFARVLLEQEGEIISIDARPSDCIVISLKSGCPIFVSEAIKHSNCIPALVYTEHHHEGDNSGTRQIEDKEAFLQFLKEVKASDFKLPSDD